MRSAVRALAAATSIVCAAVLPAGAQPPGPAAVEGPGRDPVGPFVFDLRGVMAGLPTARGWTPTLPVTTVVPSRGFGLEVGAHAYLVHWGPARVGLGGALAVARGTADAAAPGIPDVATRSITLAPQLSVNFGHRLGWSYLSAGYGAARITSVSSALGDVPATTAAPGWTGAVNIGGGARWFLTERIGAGFDARWHVLSSRQPAPGVTLFSLAVGLSVH